MTYTILSFACFFIASLLRGFAELMAFHHDETIFSARVKPGSYFGSQSSLRKYKTYSKDSMILMSAPEKGWYGWYHRRFDLPYRERFLFSATALVFLTDAFHLSNLLSRVSLILALTFAKYSPDIFNPSPIAFGLMCLKYAGIYFIGFYSTYYPLKK